MKHLLIDENLPASLANLLPIACSHATDIGQQPSDSELWLHARQHDWTILTRDTDFFDRIMLEGPPPKVIWVRLGNIRKADLESLLLRLWPANAARSFSFPFPGWVSARSKGLRTTLPLWTF